jgi:hypothetical protein
MPDEAGGRLLRTAMELRGLSARAYDRIQYDNLRYFISY